MMSGVERLVRSGEPLAALLERGIHAQILRCYHVTDVPGALCATPVQRIP